MVADVAADVGGQDLPSLGQPVFKGVLLVPAEKVKRLAALRSRLPRVAHGRGVAHRVGEQTQQESRIEQSG